MGLDQYLNKANKRFEVVNELQRYKSLSRVTEKDLNNYEDLIKGDKSNFIRHRLGDSVFVKYSEGDTRIVTQVDEYIEEFKKFFEEYSNRKALGENFDSFKTEEICYWRKHSDLQGYMANLWTSKGWMGEFNCEDLILTKEDCEAIIKHSQGELLKFQKGEDVNHETGFFWGESCEEDWTDTINAFENVLDTTNFDEETVYYSSWW